MIRRCGKLMATVTALLCLVACSVLPFRQHPEKPKPEATAGTPRRESSPSHSLWPPWKILWRKQTPPPPRAAPLLEAGTIRSISVDGSYVIAELAPGTLVQTGDVLLVTSKGHPVSRLKVAEVQPPCFAAEVEEGSAQPGDIVKR